MNTLTLTPRTDESMRYIAALIWDAQYEAGYNMEHDHFEFPMGPGGDLEELERQLREDFQRHNMSFETHVSIVGYCRS